MMWRMKVRFACIGFFCMGGALLSAQEVAKKDTITGKVH